MPFTWQRCQTHPRPADTCRDCHAAVTANTGQDARCPLCGLPLTGTSMWRRLTCPVHGTTLLTEAITWTP